MNRCYIGKPLSAVYHQCNKLTKILGSCSCLFYIESYCLLPVNVSTFSCLTYLWSCLNLPTVHCKPAISHQWHEGRVAYNAQTFPTETFQDNDTRRAQYDDTTSCDDNSTYKPSDIPPYDENFYTSSVEDMIITCGPFSLACSAVLCTSSSSCVGLRTILVTSSA